MPQVIRSPKQYDVCIIGSGAGGGMAAKILTEGGLNCALLEAGPNVNPEKDFKMWTWPYELPHRGAGVGGHARENFSEFLAPNGAWTIEGEPYTSAPAPISSGSAHASLAAAPTIGAASRCGFLPSISNLRRATASATTGPSATRPGALLRQSRRIYRRFRHQRKCLQRARRRISPSAQAPLHRADGQEGLRQAQHYLYPLTPRDSHSLRKRAFALPLLRPVRPRLRHGVEFSSSQVLLLPR